MYFESICLVCLHLDYITLENAVLSAAGDTKRPLYYLAFAGVVNVILNLFFVIVCHLGVAGVALASMISQFISAFFNLAGAVDRKGKYCLRLSEIRFDKRKAVGIFTNWNSFCFPVLTICLRQFVCAKQCQFL